MAGKSKISATIVKNHAAHGNALVRQYSLDETIDMLGYMVRSLSEARERAEASVVTLEGLDMEVQDHHLDAETIACIADGAASSLRVCCHRIERIERNMADLAVEVRSALKASRPHVG